MNYLDEVQCGIDYIEANLDSEIELAEVARRAGISQWHFQRIFKALTNETLKTYIRSRRLANALDKLAGTKERVLEIALASGFETQESFTRAFKLAFGVTPAAYRRQGSRFKFLRKVQFDGEYLRHINQNVSIEPELHDEPDRLFVGMQTRYFGIDSEKNNMARKLPVLWARFLERVDEVPRNISDKLYGILRQTPAKTDELEYFAVAQVATLDGLPKGMVSVRLPASRYAQFTHRGPVNTIDHTVNYIYSSWLAGSGLRHSYGADLECYGPDYDPASDQSVIRYAIPVNQ